MVSVVPAPARGRAARVLLPATYDHVAVSSVDLHQERTTIESLGCHQRRPTSAEEIERVFVINAGYQFGRISHCPIVEIESGLVVLQIEFGKMQWQG